MRQNHCGLFFDREDLMEIYHKIPRSKGGNDSYDKLQLLHGHCHDAKTAEDKVAVAIQDIDEDYFGVAELSNELYLSTMCITREMFVET
ncbi:MAG: HNH endonuclease signature motif containing protein [Cyanobacteria bacterium J06635_10]